MNGSWLIANPLANSVTSCNKDLNGGYGTSDEIGDSILARFIARAKKKSIRLPVLSLAYISNILKSKGKSISYSEDYSSSLKIIESDLVEVCLIYGSIVAIEAELALLRSIRNISPSTVIIVVGTFPTKYPTLFKEADSVVIGEPEQIFLDWNGDLDIFKLNGGTIFSSNIDCLDELPTPDFEGMNPSSFAYKPMLRAPTGFIESSRGCPYSCGYYCTYGENQGRNIRSYTPNTLVNMMIELSTKYNFKSYQFRDPVFGLKKNFIESFTDELLSRDIDITWGIETRSDLLDANVIELMHKAGLRSINIGIETPNKDIADQSRRKTDSEIHLQSIISLSNKLGVKINGFYILGFEADTLDSCLNTIKYSLQLNTYMARYSVCTPYPGTMYYSELDSKNKIIESDYSKFNQQTLVFDHDNLTPDQIKSLIDSAYRQYYYRPSTILKVFKNIVSS